MDGLGVTQIQTLRTIPHEWQCESFVRSGSKWMWGRRRIQGRDNSWASS